MSSNALRQGERRMKTMDAVVSLNTFDTIVSTRIDSTPGLTDVLLLAK
jgi:hypothetical protein